MKKTQDHYLQILRNAYSLHVDAEVWADFLQLPDEINVSHAAPLLVHRSKSVKEQCNIHRSNDLGKHLASMSSLGTAYFYCPGLC